MRELESVIDIPEFIKAYINLEGYEWLEEETHNFCALLMDLQYHQITKENFPTYLVDIFIPSTKFLDFYFEKMNIDKRGFCPYEEELELPQSVSNELFTVVIDGKELELVIDSYEDRRLIMFEIK